MIDAIRRIAADPPHALAGQVARRVIAMEQGARADPEQRVVGQRRQLRELARHFARSSPAFARRLADAGLVPDDLGGEGGLTRLPIVGRRAMQLPAGDLFSSAVPAQHHPVLDASSSGSTGEPVRIRRTLPTYVEWMANTMRLHLWHGAGDLSARYAVMRATIAAPVASPDWGAPAHWFGATGPLLAVPNTIAIAEQARVLSAFRPDVMLSYPSVVLALLDSALETPPKQVRTLGETLSDADKRTIESRWGCAVVDLYSSEEVGTIALACPDAPGYHLACENVITDIADDAGKPCQPGQEGRVIVTDLLNFATPILRYDIGDRAVAGGACPCGRTLPTLERILGRERNLIRMPDGTRHWPLTGRARYRDVAPVRQYQMVQVSRDRIEARLVVDRPLDFREESALSAIMIEALGHNFALDFRYFPGALPLGKNGKLEEFVCLIP